jgi:hypothetical protein
MAGARLYNGYGIDLVLDLFALPVGDAAHRVFEELNDVDTGRALPAAGERPTKRVLKQVLTGKVIDPGEIA